METIGNRIKKLRKEQKLTQGELAKSLGISAVAVGHWERETHKPESDSLFKLARALKCSPSYLLYGEESNIAEHAPQYEVIRKVPLISGVQAGAWNEIVDQFEPGDAADFIETTSDLGPHGFALRVTGLSMFNPTHDKSIPPDAVVCVHPGLEPMNGDVVVAKLKSTNEATVKQLIFDGPHIYLKPLNSEYRMIDVTDDCEIVGVVREWGKKFR